MEKILFRTLQSEIRKPDNGDSRKVTFVASTSKRDAAGTVLNQSGWLLDRFNANGIVGYQHNVYGGGLFDAAPNPDYVIGKGYAYIKDGRLMIDVEFEPAEINSLAEKVYQKILFGSLKAVSVGFIPVGKGAWGKGDEAIGKENETYYYAKQELLEVSIVNIPSNSETLKKNVKALAEEIEALKKEAGEITPEPEPEPEPDPLEVLEDEKPDDPGTQTLALEAEKEIRIAEAILRL